MAQEKGIIVNKNGRLASVKTKRTGSCEACAQRDSCGISDSSDSSMEMEIEAENLIDADVGDSVLVSLENSSLLKLSFFLYVFPIILMIIGAALGDRFQFFGLSSSISSLLTGTIFFLAAFIFIRLKSKKMSGKDEYKPKIIRKCS